MKEVAKMDKRGSFLGFVVIHAAVGFFVKKLFDRKNANRKSAYE